jgi:hypothetical protein
MGIREQIDADVKDAMRAGEKDRSDPAAGA